MSDRTRRIDANAAARALGREPLSQSPLKFDRADLCPDAARHTPSPDGYVQWHAWAEKKAKTHRQERCPTCGFWSIWKPIKRSPAAGVGGQPEEQEAQGHLSDCDGVWPCSCVTRIEGVEVVPTPAMLRAIRQDDFDRGDCPNGPDEEGGWPCDPKPIFGGDQAECQVCGRVAGSPAGVTDTEGTNDA